MDDLLEFRLSLSADAMQELIRGETIEYEVPEEGVAILLRCSDETLSLFRQQYEKVVLYAMPASPTNH